MKHETSFIIIDTPIAIHLRRALELLERDGWTQGMFTDGQGRHCILGALHRVHSQAHTVISMIINDSIPAWNDMPGRTFTEVRAALLRAIDYANGARP